MSANLASFDLPERPTQDDCDALFEFLDENLPDCDIAINAQETTRLGALTLQVLISGAKYAEENDRKFVLSAPSDGVINSLCRLGIENDYFKTEIAA